MIRAFIAVDLPGSLRERLTEAQETLRRSKTRLKVSWTKISNLHLTLQFLGDVEEGTVPKVSRAIDDVAARHAPFDLEARGLGAFPNVRRPRVIWVGCEEDQPSGIQPLVADLSRALEPLGFRPEERGFSPHLTLARVREPRPDAALTAILDSFKTVVFGTLRVEALHLLQSRLHPEGSIYTELSSHNLLRRGPTPKEI